jgi:predicted enzyme related to lactoylglutathione lyase
MITGVQDFYYNAKDLDRAVVFYSEALGMKKVYGQEHWVTMQIGSLSFGLHWSEGEDIPSTSRDSHGQFCGGTLTLKSDNIVEDREKIKRHGGKILGETEQPWGHMLVFEDLDGNVLKLMKPNR